MKTPRTAILLLCCAGIMSACEDQQARQRMQQVEADVSRMRAALQYLLADKRASFSPRSKGYSAVDTEVGRFLVSCEGAEPYLDGHKVIIQIGNPLSIACSGFTVHVRYGAPPPADKPLGDMVAWSASRDLWEKSLRETEASFTETLLPGTWTRVELIVSPSSTSDLGHMDLTMTVNQISLRNISSGK